jgi:uncharacterized protein HemX
MKTLVIAVVVALLVGLGIGGYVAHKMCMADQTAQVKEQVEAGLKALNQRVADEHAAKTATEDLLATQKTETQALATTLAASRVTIGALQQAIADAQLDAPKDPAVAPSCPGNPLAGTDFSRLYAAAAAASRPGRPTP